MIDEPQIGAPKTPAVKLTKPQRLLVRRLGELPTDDWLGDKEFADRRIVDQLEKLGLVELNGSAYRLTTVGRDVAEKSGESKFVQRQRRTIDRVAKYWSGLLEIKELRPAFHLALTRILSRELRLTPDSPLPECVCSTELMHNTFPHYCPANVPRTIAYVAHTPCDVLLEAINKIGIPCSGHYAEGSARDLILPNFIRMTIDGDVITVQREGIEAIEEGVLR